MGEVQFFTDSGMVHSDIPDDDRAFLHTQLDEYLDKRKGKYGEGFYIGDCMFFPSDGEDLTDIRHEYERRYLERRKKRAE